MSLTLTLTNVERLDNGEPTRLVLDRHGAVIGRSPHADWSLPDPKAHVSSTHCEIDFKAGEYVLIDKSTNGTFVNGAAERMSGPHTLQSGDEVAIGHYKLAVQVAGQVAKAKPEASTGAGASAGGWGDWGGGPAAKPSEGWGDTPAVAPVAASPAGWGSGSAWGDGAPGTDLDASAAPPAASGAGWGAAPVEPASGGWGAPMTEPSAGGWGSTPEPAASGWAAPAPPAPAAWGAATEAPPPAAWGAPSAAAPAWGESAAAKPAPAHGASDGGWGAGNPAPHAEPVWGAAAAPATDPWGGGAASGRGAMSQAWSPPPTQAPAETPAASGQADVWGQLASSNTVDWGRGFGEAAPAAPASTPPQPAPTAALIAAASGAALSPTPLAVNPAPPGGGWGAAKPAPSAAVGPAGGAADDATWNAFLAAAGVPSSDLKHGSGAAAEAAGRVLKRMVAGLVVMLEARARAKAQLGASSTTLEFEGNNPLKFARGPERAVAQLINPTERGFMSADRAVEDAFQDLQAHQLATLAAMQGALRSTLERFSPEAIRQRAEMRGIMAKILPGARDASLWQAYEREFEGVARGSDEAFMDVFAKAFKQAYEQATIEMKAKR